MPAGYAGPRAGGLELGRNVIDAGIGAERQAEVMTPRRSSRSLAVAYKPASQLHAAPWNCRRHIDQDELEDLAQSLRVNGQLEPILVRRSPERAGMYEIVSGERRWRAAQHAGIPDVLIRYNAALDHDDAAAYRAGLAANLEHARLNPFEETVGLLDVLLGRLAQYPGWPNYRADEDELHRASSVLRTWVRGTHLRRTQLADQLDVSPAEIERAIEQVFRQRDGLRPDSFVANRLRLLDLPPEVTAALKGGDLAYNSAKQIARVADATERQRLLKLAAEGETVRNITALVRQHLDQAQPRTASADGLRQRHADLVRRLRRLLAHPPTLDRNGLRAAVKALAHAAEVYDAHGQPPPTRGGSPEAGGAGSHSAAPLDGKEEGAA